MAIAFALIEIATPNNGDPQGWLSWALGQIKNHKITDATNSCPDLALKRRRQ